MKKLDTSTKVLIGCGVVVVAYVAGESIAKAIKDWISKQTQAQTQNPAKRTTTDAVKGAVFGAKNQKTGETEVDRVWSDLYDLVTTGSYGGKNPLSAYAQSKLKK